MPADEPMASGERLMLLGFGLAAMSFLAVLVLGFRLRRHIDRDRLLAVEELSGLWVLAPPPAALSDEGRRLNRQKRVAVALFFVGMGVVGLGILVYAVPDPEAFG